MGSPYRCQSAGLLRRGMLHWCLGGQCEEGPPPTCTTGCSAMYLPFWSDCGDVITGLGAASPDFAETATGMQSFYDTCRTAHPGKTHGGGHCAHAIDGATDSQQDSKTARQALYNVYSLESMVHSLGVNSNRSSYC